MLECSCAHTSQSAWVVMSLFRQAVCLLFAEWGTLVVCVTTSQPNPHVMNILTLASNRLCEFAGFFCLVALKCCVGMYMCVYVCAHVFVCVCVCV